MGYRLRKIFEIAVTTERKYFVSPIQTMLYDSKWFLYLDLGFLFYFLTVQPVLFLS